ncbi:MAG: hypothetical protein K0S16_2185 [Moraxellaceae bacterium]|nr:hypothetical protein [Moraxellaceae bacterium]
MPRPPLNTLYKTVCLTLLLAACAHQEAPPVTPPAEPVASLRPVAPPAPAELKREALRQERAAKVTGNVRMAEAAASADYLSGAGAVTAAPLQLSDSYLPPAENREKYQNLTDNPVKLTSRESISTFSLDVDTGSYSNVRRFLNQGQLPPNDAVRVEELVNYFSYRYPPATAGHPFSVSTEVAKAPWNPDHLLLRVGVKAVEQNIAAMPPANLVFLVDVSGSMDSPDKLPLVQSTLQLLTDQLRPQDRVAMVVYAGRTAVELPSTPGSQKDKIRAAIARLNAGGSTAGEAAIRLAYAQARAGYIKGGINRILLATDGDFNVGMSGISLTTLGFGQGNYQEALMEQIADVGNGNYSYIDSLAEARKVLVEELSSTFNTVAKDVKLQIEFNPDQVAEWRLIGYENRVLKEEDFRNDKVDAGDVGAGKSVTAIYELTPAGTDTLHATRRYAAAPKAAAGKSSELGFLRIRYKQPEGTRSIELAQPLQRPDTALLARGASAEMNFASAVAAFGQLLRQSPYTGTFGYADVHRLAQQSLADDRSGHRQEFLKLVDLAGSLTPQKPGRDTLSHHQH